eukprot:4965268-Pyramimonas_sp.AAC.1
MYTALNIRARMTSTLGINHVQKRETAVCDPFICLGTSTKPDMHDTFCWRMFCFAPLNWFSPSPGMCRGSSRGKSAKSTLGVFSHLRPWAETRRCKPVSQPAITQQAEHDRRKVEYCCGGVANNGALRISP